MGRQRQTLSELLETHTKSKLPTELCEHDRHQDHEIARTVPEQSCANIRSDAHMVGSFGLAKGLDPCYDDGDNLYRDHQGISGTDHCV